jgi:uracil-DNA glycosylase family 4
MEDQTGIPFSGASGEDLNRYLTDVHIDRHTEVFVTNVCHERPPNNKFESFLKPQLAMCLLQGILKLKQDIMDIRPNLVIALGDVPLRFLTNKHSITKYRGSILESSLVKGQKVVATYHPASVFRMYENKALIQLDMKRMAEEAKFPEIILPKRDIRVWPNGAEWVEEMFNTDWLSVDIEGTPDGIHCVGFSDSPTRALVVPVSASGADFAIRRLLSSPARKCGQNFGQYDLTVLEDRGYEVTNFQWDIMYAHHALLMESASGGDEVKALRGGKAGAKSPLAKGLGFQVSIYTKEPFYKDDGKLWSKLDTLSPEDLHNFHVYNGKDAACTYEIRSVQERELAEFGVRHVFDHEMRILPLLRQMSRRGVLIDLIQREAFRVQYTKEIDNLQAFLDKSAGKPLNVKSAPDMHKLLYETLGLPVKYHRETKRPTANKDAITELAAKYQHPVLMTILEIRRRRDLIERYINANVDADGRLRCLFDPSGTRTGRLASRANIYGSGTNLQNIPPKMRKMFIADPGKVLFYVDLSQAELRVVAYLARCDSLIEAFASGRDIHKENSERFFGSYTEEKRLAVKRTVYGSIYGEGVDRIVTVAASENPPIRLVRHEVAIAQEGFFMLYPEIKEVWWSDVKRDLKYRLLTTPLGWKRQFFGRWDSVQFINEALAFIPQCTVGVLAEIGMLNASRVEGAEVLLNEHDAILGQCDEQDVPTVVPKVIEAMQVPIPIHGRTLVIPAEAKVGRNWNEASEDNPEGLRKWKAQT